MTKAVDRFIAAHTPPLAGPDVFAGTGFIVLEIRDAITQAGVTAQILQAGHTAKQLETMATAQAALDTLLRQSKELSESLGRVLRWHLDARKVKSS